MTDITLPKDLEDWARAEVERGYAKSVDSLLADALAERRAHVEWVRGKLDEARASIAAGEVGMPLEDFMAQLDAWIAEDEAQ